MNTSHILEIENPVIDCHTHILPEQWPNWSQQFGYGGFVEMVHDTPGSARLLIDGKHFRTVESNCWCPQTRIGDCQRTSVDVQVLSTVPVMFSYWAQGRDAWDISRFLNDHIAEMVRNYPSRYIGLGTLPMQDPQLAIDELRRCVFELGMPGVQIGTHVNHWELNAPELFPVFAEAASIGACVFVHPWDMLARDRMKQYWMPWLVGMPAETSLAICHLIFGGVLERLPRLRIAFAHGGGAFPATFGRIEHAFQVRPDLMAVDNPHNPRKYLKSIYLDSLVHDPAMLAVLIGLVGCDRIMLGTDYPFPLGELEPGKVIREFAASQSMGELNTRGCSQAITTDAICNMLGRNALRWLGIASPVDSI